MLDLTRLISRAGRMPTGIDRVELAYLQNLLARPEPFFAIVRTTLGYVLLARKGAEAIAARLTGDQPWGKPDKWTILARGKPVAVRQAESDLRRAALDRVRPRRLGEMLKRHMPVGSAYVNVGHSNLSDRMMSAVRHGLHGRIAVMIHDAIPLDHPEWQRADSVDRFRGLLRRVREMADVMLYPSAVTQADVERHMQAWGDPPPGRVVHLGVNVPQPDETALPRDLDLSRPFFVALGTIEPRKGHGLLLDIWDDMGLSAPADLLIIGARGWADQALFERLNRLSPGGPVRELSGLEDAAIAPLLVRSRGLLCPSRAEGFGLPPLEAAALGVPVIVNDLPIYRETLGKVPVYVSESHRYQWINTIRTLETGAGTQEFTPPSWAEHFKTILRLT